MEPFIGEIRILGFNWAPVGWALCNGNLMPIMQNQALFSLLGTSFGGDGQSTFALPDLQGRAPRGQGHGSGLGFVSFGEKAGRETHTLLASEMPMHNHASAVEATPDAGNQDTPVEGDHLASGRVNFDDSVRNYFRGTPSSTARLNSGQTSNAGGSQPFSTMNPYLALNFSIALQGIYPSRS
ncbi:phage tail protein [Halomonas organivorans]|uniref:Microcystin-dependent protein n=1 Tax=Halomonas organivorans TaxID=257772 RepID=A0A7W5G4S4_9GAMM|nr:tail fiber protein [Halomonas organivorans]MBB3139671.1 microcystin-dependent protein [Halomonas organivorans]